MKRLMRRANDDIAVGDTVTVNFADTEQQFVVEDAHMNEICGTVTDENGESVYQCFTRPEILSIQKGVDPNAPADEDPEQEPQQEQSENPFNSFTNKEVEYKVLLPGEGGSKIYPKGTITKTGFDGVGYYAILRTDKGKEYTIREDEADKLQIL